MKQKRPPSFHLFGEPLGLILGLPHDRLEYAKTVELSIAGAESNVAIGLARLGHRCIFHTALGSDPYGERILRVLRAEKVDVSNIIIVPEAVTGLITRNCYIWREPDVFYHRRFSAFATQNEKVAETMKFAPGDVFFTTGITMALGKSTLSVVTGLMERARNSGAVVCVDVNYRRKLWNKMTFREACRRVLSKIDIMFMGREEGAVLTGLTSPAAMAKWILRQGVGEVIIKDGNKGAWHFESQKAALHGKPFVLKTVIDPIGAGDAFDAGFLSSRAEGQPRSVCLRSGNALGALVCLTPGDWESLPSQKELRDFINGGVVAVR